MLKKKSENKIKNSQLKLQKNKQKNERQDSNQKQG